MGGSARMWVGRLPARVPPRALLRLRLVMTKFDDPRVRIGWTVRLDP